MMYTKEILINRITNALNAIGLYSDSALNLVAGTIAHESTMGKFKKQIGSGIARGIAQMEPATEFDIWKNFLQHRPPLKDALIKFTGVTEPNPKALEENDDYAIAMCRIRYLRAKGELPEANDIPGLAKYWKDHYNTHLGAGKIDEWISNYKRYLS